MSTESQHHTNKKYAVMLFSTEFELGLSNKPEQWINTANYLYDNGTEALLRYANTPNPASQLIEAESDDELREKMRDMIENFKSQDWLNQNLYPYL